jgi:hypothetical protein
LTETGRSPSMSSSSITSSSPHLTDGGRKMRRVIALVVVGVAALVAVASAQAPTFQIGIIDFYGLRRVSALEARQALTFKEDDTIAPDDARLAESEHRLAVLPGVAHARTSLICCDDGRAIIYVGVEEQGQAITRFRAPPHGTARLAPDILQADDEFEPALIAAVERGDAGEDRSQGHSLVHDPATRAIQERFVSFANRDRSNLRRVLRDSSDAKQRALAAQVLGYVTNKPAVVGDLVYAMGDPSEDVRNNAMRALLVFTEATPTPTRPVTRVPFQPFVAFLNSPVWTDRNKASLALFDLSKRRDRQLLATLAHEATASLIEMARWKSKGHAEAAFMILGRIAGLSEEAIQTAWDRDERETVISAALNRR